MALTAAQLVVKIDEVIEKILTRGGEYQILGRRWSNLNLTELMKLREVYAAQAASVSGKRQASVGTFQKEGL